MINNIPKVFISYAWSSNVHFEKIRTLVEKLRFDGVDTIWDQTDLKTGQDKYRFMEMAVTSQETNNVLVICDKNYMDKANENRGGVGTETQIISPQIYNDTQQTKFIPIIFEKNEKNEPYLPTFLNSRMYIDMANEIDFENNYNKLVRDIYKKPLYIKTPLGSRPSWLDNEDVNYSPLILSIERLNKIDNQKQLLSLSKKILNNYINIIQENKVKTVITSAQILSLIEKLKPVRDLYIDLLEILIEKNVKVIEIVPMFLEQIYNKSMNTNEGYLPVLESFQFLIWEIFLCTITLFYYHQMYEEIYELLTHTYFLNESNYEFSNNSPSKFTKFRPYFRTLDGNIIQKYGEKKMLSNAAETLIHREKIPFIRRENIVFSDILLCQLSFTKNIQDTNNNEKRYSNEWFPLSYVYQNHTKNEWKKLMSANFCEKAMVMFGATTIEELKKLVKNSSIPMDFSYQNSFLRIPGIIDVINIEDVGTYN
jgi:hypothetical protein